MIYPEISKLMEGFDSRYSLVTAVAKRARQLATDTSDDKTVSRAVNEIANGKIRCVKNKENEDQEEASQETVNEETVIESAVLE